MNRLTAAAAWARMLAFILDTMEERGTTPADMAEATGQPVERMVRILEGGEFPDVVTFVQMLAAVELNPHLIPKELDVLPYPRIPDPGEN